MSTLAIGPMQVSLRREQHPKLLAGVRFGENKASNMLSLDDIRNILKDVKYKDWIFRTYRENERMILQVQFNAPDSETGQNELQSGRKWFLSPHMTKSEVVQTALKAVLTAEEHEAREQFRYKGQPIFGPHFDVDALVDLCQGKRFDKRG